MFSGRSVKLVLAVVVTVGALLNQAHVAIADELVPCVENPTTGNCLPCSGTDLQGCQDALQERAEYLPVWLNQVDQANQNTLQITTSFANDVAGEAYCLADEAPRVDDCVDRDFHTLNGLGMKLFTAFIAAATLYVALVEAWNRM